MLELGNGGFRIVRYVGRARDLEDLAVPADGFSFRVADDETLLVLPVPGTDGRAASLPRVTAVDETDAWVLWTLTGSDFEEAFRRISDLTLPPERPALLQGAIAGVPGKSVVFDGGIHVLVPSPLSHRLERRLFVSCRDLEPMVRPPRVRSPEHV